MVLSLPYPIKTYHFELNEFLLLLKYAHFVPIGKKMRNKCFDFFASILPSMLA